MPAMLVAQRWALPGQWEKCRIGDAVYRRKSTYRCLRCNRHVVPHGELPTAHFKHVTVSFGCPFSRPKPGTRKRARSSTG